VRQRLFLRVAKLLSLIAAVGEQFSKKRKFSKQGPQNETAAVAVLNVGGMDDRVQQQTYGVNENMPFLALDLLARIIAVRINAAPPFSPAFTLWLSMTAAVGLASRAAASRHFT
jgi:hypothetical protein